MSLIKDYILAYLAEARNDAEYHFKLTNLLLAGGILIFVPLVGIIQLLITLFWSK